MTKETLHLYRDGDGNAYAARDLAHAKELWTNDTGQPAEEAGQWKCIPDESMVLDGDEETGALHAKTAAQYAREAHGPGCVGELG